MAPRPLLRALRRLPAKLRRFVGGVVALAVVTTTLLAGHTYFYCAPMHRVGFDTCCPEEAEPHHGEAESERALAIEETHRCCEPRSFAQGDRGGEPTASVSVAPSPVSAVLPAVPEAVARIARMAVPPPPYDTRAGPPRASPLAHRVPVDVSLT